jgi:SnoaL-like domain
MAIVKMSDRVIWELEQRRQITETLMDYCHFVDRNDPAALVDKVFCADGCFELGARHAVGSENLARMFAKTLAAFTATSHHLSNVRIRFTDDDTAESTAYVYAWHIAVGDRRRIDLWGRYRDNLRCTAQGWRIANRRLTVAGSDGWQDPPFDLAERLPNPADTPSPVITKRF